MNTDKPKAEIHVNSLGGKQMAIGTYTLKATYNGKDFVKTFEVTKTVSDLRDILKVVYDGKELKKTDYTIACTGQTL